MIIRPAEIKDLEAIVALQVKHVKYHITIDPDYYSDYDDNYSISKDQEFFAAEIKKSPSTVLVAEDSNQIVGFITFEKSHSQYNDSKMKPLGEIVSVIIDENYRHQGIASKLIFAAEELLRQQGFQYATLRVSTHNPPAIKLYEKLGYLDRQRLMFKKL